MELRENSARMSARVLADRFEELARLLERTSDLDYIWRPPDDLSGSVGAHVRHCLDHVQALLDHHGRVISYDLRERDTPVEHDRMLAVNALRRALRRLYALRPLVSEDQLTLSALLDRTGTRVLVDTSLERELVFVLQHTIHHQAVITLLLAERGARVPTGFGYAPSTPIQEVSRGGRLGEASLR